MQTSRNKLSSGFGVLERQIGVAGDGLIDAKDVYSGNVLEFGFWVSNLKIVKQLVRGTNLPS
jgi:hypothetical protein